MQHTRPQQDSQPQTGYPGSTFTIDDHGTQRISAILAEVSQALEVENIRDAERHLRDGLQEFPEHPKFLSYLSICVASAGRELEAAEELARRIIEDHPTEPAGHFALGQVKLLGEKRRFAFMNFSRARRLAGADRHILQELDRVEPRRAPVFTQFERDHFLNVFFGRIRAKLERWFGRSR